MRQYVFTRPIPVAELNGELQAFARQVAQDGFDTVTAMIVTLMPVRAGKPHQILQRDSDIPITKVIYESRLYKEVRKPRVDDKR